MYDELEDDEEDQRAWNVGDEAIARCKYEGFWKRARIVVVHHDGSRRVEGLFVDYGTLQEVQMRDLRVPGGEFSQVPILSVRIILDEFVPLEGF